jgi:penicillin-binding protein 2
VSLSEPPEDPRTRANLNPALSVRVGIVGSIILGLFAIVFFRLWFLQVLTGAQYVQAAALNTTQRVPVAPARGEILSRTGLPLVTSTTQLAAVVVPSELPVKVNQTSYGYQDVKVNAEGIPVGQGRKKTPVAGDDLKTTLDLKLQQTGDAALARAVGAVGNYGGAYVAMNPQNGSIYAMGSNPSFDPSVFTGNNSLKAVAALEHDSRAPLYNRAVQTEVGDGSTFKVITSVAALQSGVWSPDKTFDDTGHICFGTYCPRNAAGVANGVIDMETALKVSDDVFYYNLGALLNSTKPQGGALQRWARRFGIGRNPHIDLPSAEVDDGLLPTPAWFDHTSELESECEAGRGQFRYTDGKGDYSPKPKHGYHRTPKNPYDPATGTGGCGLGTPGAVWTIGQNVETAVGQGEDEVSPLQLALVYSAIENGGRIVRPHIAQDIQSPDGTILQRLLFPTQRRLQIDPAYLNTIRTGLHEAAQTPGGTSAAVMENFGMPVYGKTGTAQTFEHGVETDNAWYATYVPASATHKPMLVIVYIENGGYGAIGAAPVARQIMSQWYYGKPGPWVTGELSAQ